LSAGVQPKGGRQGTPSLKTIGGTFMRVEEIITPENKTRYLLVDDDGEPVKPVLKFLKYKDNSGKARNTLRAYCYHLKAFFDFLQQKEMDYLNIGVDEMAEFMRWLQNPYGNVKVAPIKPLEPVKKPRTVNIYISTVMEFYDYLMRHEDYSIQLSEKLKRQILGSHRGFKDFLYHINKSRDYDAKVLKAKVPKEQPKTISKEKIAQLIDACSNLRDKFLIQLLWESAMRIGEALALWLEDFEIDARRIHIRDRGELPNLAEIKTICSPRIIDVSADLMNMYMDYVAEYHTDEVDTNHVFIKLFGDNQYQPLEYPDINSLFMRLRKKTGIYVTPHMLRHSSLTELRKAGWGIEYLQKRAGHGCIQSTYIYMHPDDDDIRNDWEQAEKRMELKKINNGDEHK
jgi:site-specific recombinase XerD